MNKAQLVDHLSDRFGGRRQAAEALDHVLDTIQRTVTAGEKVVITGFGVFEKVDRPARTARNPATGERVQGKEDVGAQVPSRLEFQELREWSEEAAQGRGWCGQEGHESATGAATGATATAKSVRSRRDDGVQGAGEEDIDEAAASEEVDDDRSPRPPRSLLPPRGLRPKKSSTKQDIGREEVDHHEGKRREDDDEAGRQEGVGNAGARDGNRPVGPGRHTGRAGSQSSRARSGAAQHLAIAPPLQRRRN